MVDTLHLTLHLNLHPNNFQILSNDNLYLRRIAYWFHGSDTESDTEFQKSATNPKAAKKQTAATTTRIFKRHSRILRSRLCSVENDGIRSLQCAEGN